MQDKAQTLKYTTQGGIGIERTKSKLDYQSALDSVLHGLDTRVGLLFASSFEYPGRYERWDMGFIDPPLCITAWGRRMKIKALNQRGEVLIPAFADALHQSDAVSQIEHDDKVISLVVKHSEEIFAEELRSKQPSVFSVLRVLIELMSSTQDKALGLYGAFGYELAFQFEPVELKLDRDQSSRDLVLYIPDQIIIVDHRKENAYQYDYDFAVAGNNSENIPRAGETIAYRPAKFTGKDCDHASGEYANTVRKAIQHFERGDLFEVVPGQTFYRPCSASPVEVFKRLKARNPAPYGALINLGNAEYLVAASPEMFIRVEGKRIETCPISGTVKRGRNAIEDAKHIRELLNSVKEESELTMCTDVDRNDKSRVCIPESIKVIGRRQLELYSRLIHTVDHVEAELRPEFDALDAFLAHTWAVTVTGAPKQRAIQFIEENEKSPRRWYGGAIGMVGFAGQMNTGLTLRTIRISEGVAEVRAGATLLFESDPDAEESETRLKASALLDAILNADNSERLKNNEIRKSVEHRSDRKKVLIIDHDDSFVHTLAGYVRRTGAEVVTYRSGFAANIFDQQKYDLVLLSPGPGLPMDFTLNNTIREILQRKIPIFGVCLGLQGIVEFFGGTLETLAQPVHGKASKIYQQQALIDSESVYHSKLFADLPDFFAAGRYHSLYADKTTWPNDLVVTAATDDGLVMAVEHKELPIAAVQFHPESILTLDQDIGMRLIENVMSNLAT